MKKIFKWIFLILFIISIIIGFFYYKNIALKVDVVKLEKKDVEMYFIEQGEVITSKEMEVFSASPGLIKIVNVYENQKINKGDIICVIDTDIYNFQIGEINSSIKGYEAQIKNLKATEEKEKDSLITSKQDLLAQLEALKAQKKSSDVSKEERVQLQEKVINQYKENMSFANDNFLKIKTLYEGGVIPKKDFDDAKKILEDSKLNLEQSEKQLELIKNISETGSDDYYQAMENSLNVQINGLTNTIEKSYINEMTEYYNTLIEGGKYSIESMKKKISEGTIVSPFSGVVKKLYIDNTNIVNPQSPLITIKSEEDDYIEVYVSTKDIDVVKNIKEVELILKRRDKDKKYTGKIFEIDDEAITKISSLGIEEKKVKIKVQPDDKEEFKVGYDTDVKFIFYKENNKITVPKTALFKSDDLDMVFIVENNIIVKKQIVKGTELRTDFVVESGLMESDIVIKDCDNDKLKEGIKVSFD